MGAWKLPPWAPVAMAGWRSLGETYREIGSRFGVTGERARQVLAAIGKAGPLPRPAFCVVPGCEGARWVGSKQYCRLHAQRVGRTGDPGPVDFINKPRPDRCADCGGRFVPNGKSGQRGKRHQGRGLCQGCYSRARYAAWTPAQRARHAALCARWAESHPEQRREIQRRATRAYQARQKAKRQQEAQQP